MPCPFRRWRGCRHIADGVHIDRKTDGVQSQPGGGQRGLNARVARTDNGDVTASGVITHDEGSSGFPIRITTIFYSTRLRHECKSGCASIGRKRLCSICTKNAKKGIAFIVLMVI